MPFAKGIVKVIFNRPFYILVASPPNLSVNVAKRTKLENQSIQVPILGRDRDGQFRGLTWERHSDLIFKKNIDKMTLILRHQEVMTRQEDKSEKG